MADEAQGSVEKRLADSFEKLDERLTGIEARLGWLLGAVVASAVVRTILVFV